MPFDYYSIPFSKPVGGVKKSTGTINPGTILLGIRIENSPYNFSMMEDTKTQTVCNGEEYPDHAYPALGPKEAKVRRRRRGGAGGEMLAGGVLLAAARSRACLGFGPRLTPPLPAGPPQKLQDKIKQQYRVRLILDNLPITTYDLELDPESGAQGAGRGRQGSTAQRRMPPLGPRQTIPDPALTPPPLRSPGRPPRAVRPGFEAGYIVDKKFYVNNHLMFKVLVHESNGMYSRMKQEEAELEAAAAVEVRRGGAEGRGGPPAGGSVGGGAGGQRAGVAARCA